MTGFAKNPARLVPLAFLAVILLGTLVLMLPIARTGGGSAPFMTALFVATSAVVVVPAAAFARPAVLLPRWDRHLVPLPFARAIVVLGEPIDTRATGDGFTVASLNEAIGRSLTEVAGRARAALA